MMNVAVGDLVQMDPPRMKRLGKTIGVVVQLGDRDEQVVRVHWGNYGTFWTMKKLLKNLSQEDDIGDQSSI